MNKKKLILIVIPLFFLFYTFFWIQFFKVKTKNQSSMPTPSFVETSILGSETYVPTPGVEITLTPGVETGVEIPENYKIEIMPRKQAFNLSCEFAAALAVLYHFTKDANFAVENEERAEKILIEKIGVSQNPNIGVRMGIDLPEDLETLYANLNKNFGGSDYYGVHAPPFIDLFENYKLKARPIDKESDLIKSIQKAISSDHLLMAWISIGYNQPIDIALSYGKVPIVKGEHTVVINGYDKNGIFFMDPGIGKERYSSYQVFFQAIREFSMPFLEISPSLSLETSPLSLETSPLSNQNDSVETAFLADQRAGLNRSDFKIAVKNGTKKIGKASELADILEDFGYKIVSIENADNFDYEGVNIRFKKEMKDYLYFLKKDLNVAFYNILDITANISKDDQVDAILVVGN